MLLDAHVKENYKVLLMLLPFWTPQIPTLGIACLKSTIQGHGYEVRTVMGAGFYRARQGLESGSPHLLELLGKKIAQPLMSECMAELRDCRGDQ